MRAHTIKFLYSLVMPSLLSFFPSSPPIPRLTSDWHCCSEAHGPQTKPFQNRKCSLCWGDSSLKKKKKTADINQITCQYNILLHSRILQLYADLLKLPYMVFCKTQRGCRKTYDGFYILMLGQIQTTTTKIKSLCGCLSDAVKITSQENMHKQQGGTISKPS